MFQLGGWLWLAGCPQAPPTEEQDSTPVVDEPTAMVELVVEPAALDILAGRSASVAVTVAVTTITGEVGPAEVVLADAPEWLSADPLQLPLASPQGTLTLHVAADASLGGPVAARVEVGGAFVQTASAALDVTVLPAPGSLVRSFGEQGKVYYDVAGDSAQPFDLALDDKGRILLCGQRRGVIWDGFVMRFTPDGTPDSTFGTDGAVLVEDHQTSIWHVLPRPDGGVLAYVFGDAAISSTNYAIWALSDGGTFDAGFGDKGVLEAPLATAFEGGADRFVAAGFLGVSTYAWDGTLDLELDSSDDLPTPWDATFDDQGRLLVAGSESGEVVARYELDGRLDRDFGDRGIAPLPLWVPRAITTTDSGITVFGNYRDSFEDEGLRLVRLTQAGELDPGFGTDGTVDVFDEHGGTEPKFVQQPDGAVIVGPTWDRDGQILWRYNADGTLDESFGTDGMVRVETALGLAVDPVTNQLVISGFDTAGLYLMRLHL